MDIATIKLSWTAGALGAVVNMPVSMAPYKNRFMLYSVQTDPDGTVAPSANYKVAVENAEGCDLLEGGGAGRSATATEMKYAAMGSIPMAVPITGDLVVKISSNSVVGAKGDVYLHLVS